MEGDQPPRHRPSRRRQHRGRTGVSARCHLASRLRRSISQVVVAALSSDMYKSRFSECTVHGVNVSVTELRAHLSDWLDRARAGGEVVITDRGIPVARLAALDSAGTLERLTAEGVIGTATAQRPVAAGRSGPRPRRPVSDRVSDQRR
jgi:prevent-host-death family protein